MKLIFCKKCQDLVRLAASDRFCACTESGGCYVDELNAVYYGENAVPIGVNNGLLRNAINMQPDEGLGKVFEAFVIPKNCSTMKKVEK